MRRALLTAFLTSALFVCIGATARAGGSAETTLVVANANSPISLRVAHAYRELRDLPASHVLYLEDVPDKLVIDVETFRTRILGPIEAWLEAQGLQDDIDTIAYSTGFPYGVDFQPDVKASGFKPGREISRTASLTGLTYLGRHVLEKDPATYLDLLTNRYFRQPLGLPRPGQTATTRLTAEERRLLAAAQGALRSKDWRRGAKTFEALLELDSEQPAYWYDLACCRALLGQEKEALDALEQAVETGFTRADHADQDPDFTTIRKGERFQDLIQRMRIGAENGSRLGRVETLSRGFSNRIGWDENGRPLPLEDEGEGRRYRLAVMLGWAGPNGNDLEEILACLRRARQSDGSFPDGGFYLMANKNVRATARMPFFPATVGALERLGFEAEVLKAGAGGQNGTLPAGRPRIAGLQAGTASFKWPKGMPELLPGAIAEHLTSFGAHFGTKSQTKCTEFIRHGAAGSSGTVAEPFAIWMKFPLPFVHVHYARGCSLAEAFYQSIWGPYQLLILGDPLARPFARFTDVMISSPDVSTAWSGRVAVRAATVDEAQRAPAGYELWIDGRRVAEADPGEPLDWDTTTIDDGTHDLRVVAIEAGPVGSRSTARAWVEIRNADLTLSLDAPDEANLGEVLHLEGKATGVDEVEIRQGSRIVATARTKRDRYRVDVPTTLLGPGRVMLQARGSGGSKGVLSAPVEIEITPTALTTASTSMPKHGVLPGLGATIELEGGGERTAIVTTLASRGHRTITKDLAVVLDGGAKVKRVRLAGHANLPEGVTEIALEFGGSCTLTVDGVELLETTAASPRTAQVLLIPGGWHKIELVADGPKLDGWGLRIAGSRAAGPLGGRELRHVPADWVPATRPKAVRGVKTGSEVFDLNNGNRGGKGVLAWSEGVAFEWKRSERKLAAVVLFPARGADAPAFPDAWIVETRSSARGRWREVKKATSLIVPGPEAPKKDKVIPPAFIVIRFARTSAQQLRVRPVDADVTPRITEIEVYRDK